MKFPRILPAFPRELRYKLPLPAGIEKGGKTTTAPMRLRRTELRIHMQSIKMIGRRRYVLINTILVNRVGGLKV